MRIYIERPSESIAKGPRALRRPVRQLQPSKVGKNGNTPKSGRHSLIQTIQKSSEDRIRGSVPYDTTSGGIHRIAVKMCTHKTETVRHI